MATLYTLYVLISLFCVVRSQILCEDGFCRSYGFDVGCTPPAQHCSINNATHTGIWLLSPTTCNCCDYCLPFIEEGDHCTIGGPGTGTTVGRCGDGLTCVVEEDGSFCRRMESECHSAQDDYDSRHELGQIGALEQRPGCDGKGRYQHYYCVPTQTCFCQSDEGERLFGEVLHQGAVTERNMHCGCSRLHHKIKTSISPGVPRPVVGLRCTSDGNFNPMQCLGDICYCVDEITGVIKGDERINLDIEPLSELSCFPQPVVGLRCTSDGNFNPMQCLGDICYCVDEITGVIKGDERINLDIEPLSCYDAALDLFPSIGNRPFNYTSPCLEDMKERIALLDESERDGFIVDYYSTVPECLPDATYGRVVRTGYGSKVCVNERGQPIEKYEAMYGAPGYDEMNCNCAQTELLMANQSEKPVCCKNGNFRRIQCRRGACRCVDSDGRQVGLESSNLEDLRCYNADEDWRNC